MLRGYKVPKSENKLFMALDRTWFTLDKFILLTFIYENSEKFTHLHEI
jgi:hypothetical protein